MTYELVNVPELNFELIHVEYELSQDLAIH